MNTAWNLTFSIRVERRISDSILIINNNTSEKELSQKISSQVANSAVRVTDFSSKHWNTVRETEGLQTDFNLLSKSERLTVEKEIRDYIYNKERDRKFYVASDKDEIIHHTVCSYARSLKVYGPVATKWVEYLLDKANAGNQKLVFMARDGIAPYKMACEMMKSEKYRGKYPNLIGENKLVLAYFSRALVKNSQSSDSNKNLFDKYVRQLGIQDDEQCIFVDVGFTGSMIDSIRRLLPHVKINFDYLISHTDHADGFMYSANNPHLANKQNPQTIQAIGYRGASGNSAIHWLEDSHQGVGKSPTFLVEVNDVVYPNTRVPGKKEYIVDRGSHDYLIRKFASKAIQRSLTQYNAENVSKEEAVKKFDAALCKIAQKTIPHLIKHI